MKIIACRSLDQSLLPIENTLFVGPFYNLLCLTILTILLTNRESSVVKGQNTMYPFPLDGPFNTSLYITTDDFTCKCRKSSGES